MLFPDLIPNWISNQERPAAAGETFDKITPIDSTKLCKTARSRAADVRQAVVEAKKAQAAWGELPVVARGNALHDLAMGLKKHREAIAQIVAKETGKSFKAALGETDGAIALGTFYAGEGQRLYGRTTTSGVPYRQAMTVRQPLGVAGLIIAANTPIANVAWKIFPAMICGNAAVLKAAEDTPISAWKVGQIAKEVGLPAGILQIIQGYGTEAGTPLVSDPDVPVVSFTGSTEVGRQIQRIAGERLARVSLELGGKNALIVCDDADLDSAAHWVLQSAFSNAGQRCAAASRVIVFDAVYDKFREMLIERTRKLKVGPNDADDFGPVINARQLQKMVDAVEKARSTGAKILTGGHRLTDADHQAGCYLAPTLIDGVAHSDEISCKELFGPIACLYRVKGFDEAIAMANDCAYGLTSCIHTRNIHRAMRFIQKIEAGVATVNGGTFGSEPHMPFGGVKQSGNGWREPGTEALDIYSNLKDVYINVDPQGV